MKKNVLRLFVTLLAVFALAFAANCGGDDGDSGDKDTGTTTDVVDDTAVPEDDTGVPDEDIAVDPCEGVECEDGFSCVDGECVEDVVVDPCEGVECEDGFSCVDGECVEDVVVDPCEGVECEDGFSCVEGECVEDVVVDPCEGVECDEGSSCVWGECVVPGDGCTNEADMAVLKGDPEVSAKIKDCAMNCMAEEDKVTCATDCIVADTGLGADCAGCYTGTFMCSVASCLTQCLADPDSMPCVICQAEFCAGEFLACAGIPLGGGE